MNPTLNILDGLLHFMFYMIDLPGIKHLNLEDLNPEIIFQYFVQK